MNVIADLQLHSKYSRAVSQHMILPEIDRWSRRKGIGLIATGDWNHPLWMREIKMNLEEMGNGLLQLKKDFIDHEFTEGGSSTPPFFLLATEVSSIFSQGGKSRRIHTLIWAPSLAAADKINAELVKRGANLMSDGRPIIGLSCIEVADIAFSVDERCLVIPAHAWTPWFGLYGSMSGFDSIDEAYGKFSPYIYAIETGLSSDPAMNWRIKELDHRSVVSFSDAHSGPKLGREATVFSLDELSYDAIRSAIMRPQNKGKHTDGNKIKYSIEFYPEEGKYHYTGHRNCGIKHAPGDTKSKGMICPVCGKPLTVGVMHRVEELAGRTEDDLQLKHIKIGESTKAVSSETFPNRPPYVMMVPLAEIIAEAMHSMPTTQKVQTEYLNLVNTLGGEFRVLLGASLAEITQVSGVKIAEGVQKVRDGNIVIDPGYDGVFGVVKIWQDGEKKTVQPTALTEDKEQMRLF